MSLQHPITVPCPLCGSSQEGTWWQSVNRQVNPELIDSILDLSIFMHRCTGCGASYPLPLPLLYHDMELQLMIQLDPHGGEYTAGPEVMAEFRKTAPGYRYRLVERPEELAEKVFLSLLGFDDRLVECFKAYQARKDPKRQIPVGARVLVRRFDPPAPAPAYQWVHLNCCTDTGWVEAVYPYKQLFATITNCRRLVPSKEQHYAQPFWRRIDLFYGQWICFNTPLNPIVPNPKAVWEMPGWVPGSPLFREPDWPDPPPYIEVTRSRRR